MMAKQPQSYVPESQTVAQTVAVLEEKGRLSTAPKSGEPPVSPSARPSKPRPAIVLKGVDIAASLNVSIPAQSSSGNIRPGEDYDGAISELDIDDIDPYDKNPRTERNPRYEEIKSAIRSRRGLDGGLTVTKRPGSHRYMLYMGGNTRLAILHELYLETGDPCFKKVCCTHHRWSSESDVLFSHYVENEARGDTLFIEKARAIVSFKQLLEEAGGPPLSARDVERATKEQGLRVPNSMVALYCYAVDSLEILGPWLTKDNVGAIRKHHSLLESLCGKIVAAGKFASEYPAIFQRILNKTNQTLNDLKAEVQAAVDSEKESKATSVGLRGLQLDSLLFELTNALAELLQIEPKRFEQLVRVADSASAEQLSAILHNGTPESSNTDNATGAATPPQTNEQTDQQGSSSQEINKVEGGSSMLPPSTTDGSTGVSPEAESPATNGASKLKGRSSSSLAQAKETKPSAASASDLDPEQAFQDALIEFAKASFVIDCIRQWEPSLGPVLPLGYWLELPDDKYNDASLSDDDQLLRSAAYRTLAMLFGQLGGMSGFNDTEREFANLLPDGSTWKEAALADSMSPESFPLVWEGQFFGELTQDQRLLIGRNDVLKLLLHPLAGPPFSRILYNYQRWHSQLQMLMQETSC